MFYRARPEPRCVRGVDWPLFAIVGGIATGASFLVIIVAEPDDAVGRPRLDRSPGSCSTSSTAAAS